MAEQVIKPFKSCFRLLCIAFFTFCGRGLGILLGKTGRQNFFKTLSWPVAFQSFNTTLLSILTRAAN
jgi:hypothetical protein